MGSLSIQNSSENTQVSDIRGYYQWHARVYQATRWTFLFGRKRIIEVLRLPLLNHKTVVEVGCGTGHNLTALADRYRNMHLIGVDVSPDMLAVAARRLRKFSRRVLFMEKAYAPGSWQLPAKPDIVLFSYCLTMINPGWEAALQRAGEDLSAGDTIAVVDFHGSPFRLFRRWMGYNHVRMEEHIVPMLKEKFQTVKLEIHQAYGGLWTYFVYVGKKGC